MSSLDYLYRSTRAFFDRVYLITTTTVRRLTVYDRVRRAQEEQDVVKSESLLKALSKSRMQSISILCASLGPFSQLPSVIPATWIIFLLLLSGTATAFCDRIHSVDLPALGLGLFTLIHSIPGLSVYAVLLAAMIRSSGNAAIIAVQLLFIVGGFALMVVFLLWKSGSDESEEPVAVVDEENGL